MPELCNFSYSSFTLSFIYLILFFLVLRYLINLIQENSRKKRAQKIFLAILMAQTLLRVLYFLLFPFYTSVCSPSMRDRRPRPKSLEKVEWWLHLLGNLPAELFLLAFSVLVYTFARIYHKVLLSGVWFQARRFKMLTLVLVALNVLTIVTTFGDWAYAGSNSNATLYPFVDMMLWCVLGVSFVLAGCFLAYGALLFYQVQSIMRASGENAAPNLHEQHHLEHQSGDSAFSSPVRGGSGGGAYQPPSFTGGKQSQPGFNPTILLPPAAPATPGGLLTAGAGAGVAVLTPSDASTGFTPAVHKKASKGGSRRPRRGTNGAIVSVSELARPHRADRDADAEEYDAEADEEEEGEEGGESSSYEGLPPPPVSALGVAGVNSSPHQRGRQTVTTSVSGLVYPITTSGFASPSATSHATPTPTVKVPVKKGQQRGSIVGPASAALTVDSKGGAQSYASSHSPSYSPHLMEAMLNAAKAEETSPFAEGEAASAQQESPGYSTPRAAATKSFAAVAQPVVSRGYLEGVSASESESDDSEQGVVNREGLRNPVRSSRSKRSFDSEQAGMTNALLLPAPHTSVDSSEQEGLYPQVGGSRATSAAAAPTRYAEQSSYATSYPYYSQQGADPHALMSPSASSGLAPLLPVSSPSHLYPSYNGSADRSWVHVSAPERPPTHSATSPAPSSLPLPPNPMRKIAVIASICTVCLLLRTTLIVTFLGLHTDFDPVATLFYFMLSEILPLIAMLKVFNTPTPQVQGLGGGGGY